MLASLERRDWDDELLALFGVPRSILPEVRGSCEVVAEARLLGTTLPVAGVVGDQQASLHGHGCIGPGQAKATYGTGSFVLAHAGADLSSPPHGLLRTAAVEGTALEGSIFVAGAALQWLRDGLGLLADASESEALATSVRDTDGVHFVPALAGLGSPHWAPDARGVVSGLTRATRREHIVRAALEAIAFQVRDVLESLPVDVLRADGGVTQNSFVMQFQSDLLGVPVEVAREPETTALGAAALAAKALGLRDGPPRPSPGSTYEPRLSRDEADARYAGWRDAVRRALP
jgi:glycerol kinase